MNVRMKPLSCGKRRFTLDRARSRIRANQGHSISVDLGLAPRRPPERLYHGTAAAFLRSILENGLHPRRRHHVHLSPDRETALAVGRRHGEPVVLRADARRMFDEGHRFLLSENGVWLTERVPPAFLTLDDPAR